MQKLIETLITNGIGALFSKSTKQVPPQASYQTQLTPPQFWAILTGGILTLNNQDTFATLQNDMTPAEAQSILKNWWGVHNEAETIEMLDWLTTTGHSKRFEPVYQAVVNLSPEAFESFYNTLPEDQKVVHRFVWDSRNWFIGGSLMAWDLVRLINICRWAYTAQYINEEVAWQKIMEAAHKLQATYHSWNELFDNYNLGYRFWKNGAVLGKKEAQATLQLKTAPDSPCKTIPWNLSLN